MNKLYRSPALKVLILCCLLLPLAGCDKDGPWLWILHPNGPLARSSVFYLVVDVLLLGLIILPATVLLIWVYFRFRRGGSGRYDPTFNHSWTIEGIVWGFPLVLVGVMSYFSYQGMRAVGPYNPQAVQAEVAQQKNPPPPLKVDVISTDWQWLFIYPKLHIAVANRLIVPTHRKVELRLTAVGATNDFYILKVVNQIYAMPGMRTKHNFLLDRTGTYRGYSTEFSGPGFAWMNYDLKVVKPGAFQDWVTKAQSSSHQMDMAQFKQFAQPTVNTGNTWTVYGSVAPHLFNDVIADVKSGQLTGSWPMRLTEDMTSKEFARQHGTGPKSSQPFDGTNAN
ncbi:cytochrome c oxidase subunit II [Salinisphaera sp. LB1]|uniref:ubiquinol oxidase subunit II n=1 Tax=Salinisphaera sp. LB1 TaxID=2183911 RepID=UPI000D707F34|nr:cytochrome c oxidase subunit II [Salinisphaera sp. LB1]AWN14806.1 Cytochrome O ubiquinol oxidase subunit II [Salinisphaera sp. LB1]